jgi:hypothetical protein
MRAPSVFLLDTDHLGIIQDRVQPECQRLLDRIGQFPATAFYVSIVSFHEHCLSTMWLAVDLRRFADSACGSAPWTCGSRPSPWPAASRS